MKVAIIGPSGKFLSGVSYFTARLSKALSEHCEVDTILFRNLLPKFLFPGHRRVGYKTLQENYTNGTVDWNNPFTWRDAATHCNNSDVVIFQWWTASVGHMYYFISGYTRKPIIIEFHEVADQKEQSFLLSWYSRAVMGALVKRAIGFVAHSEADRKRISAGYNIPVEKITVIPLGLFDQYTRLPKETTGKTILFFGLIRPYKGLQHLLEAFEQLPTDTNLIIAGEVWEDKYVVEHISPTTPRITLIDKYISDVDVSYYFSQADVLVLPYVRASQSGVAHIGMAMGLPIVASRVGGIAESLANYGGTYFTEPANVQDLVEKTTLALDDNNRYPPPPELTWGVVGKQWINYLQEITG